MSFFAALFAATLISTHPLEKAEKFQSSEEGMIYFIRHGESVLNVPDPTTGLLITMGKGIEVPLTEKGKIQAKSLGTKIAQKIPQDREIVVCCSASRRAEETAHLIVKKLQKISSCIFGGAYEGLCEQGAGKWEGLPKDALYHEKLALWEGLSARDKLAAPKFEGTESYRDVFERTLPEIKNILETFPGKLIFVVSHFQTLNALQFHLNYENDEFTTEPKTKLPFISLQNCDLLLLEVPEGNSLAKGQIVTHLTSDI